MPKNNRRGGQAPMWASQNFLTGRAEILRLLNISDICKRDHVLEIGPGKGHITRELIGRCRRLTAVELDHSLWARLGAVRGGRKAHPYRGGFSQNSTAKGTL